MTTDEENSSFEVEGVDRILIPTSDLKTELKYFSDVFGLKPMNKGKATNDPFLQAFAIIQTPNGIVLELVTPKKEYEALFCKPIYCYTVEELPEKRKLLQKNGCQLLGDIIDTKSGWGWFYTISPSGILSQLQGQLAVDNPEENHI